MTIETYEPEHLELWERPDSYMGETYFEYYPIRGQSRDSGILEKSNFECTLEALGGESETVIVARASHWAVGWVETILVHKSDSVNVEKAESIVCALADYPILNDEHYSNLESETADATWNKCFDNEERIEHLRENWDYYKSDIRDYSDLISIVRGQYAPNGRCGYELVLDCTDY